MFGYITINRDELKVRELETYRQFYCGICRDLKERSGERARATLTYDMTFLAILLTALYEEPVSREMHRCLYRGGVRRMSLNNQYTAYAADMNLLLAYHNLIDDWVDDHNRRHLAAARLLTSAYRKTAAQYPEKVRAIRRYLKALHQVERSGNADPDLAAGLTGELMREIFLYQKDRWSRDLGEVGFYLGKFIYLKDAWDDREADRKSGSYNPFSSVPDDPERTNELLTMMAAGAARAFERLPVVEYTGILRNILYTGLWVKKSRRTGLRNMHRREKQKEQYAGSI